MGKAGRRIGQLLGSYEEKQYFAEKRVEAFCSRDSFRTVVIGVSMNASLRR
jgi:hypothetical protein